MDARDVNSLVKIFEEYERELSSILDMISSRYDELIKYAEELANRYASEFEKEINSLIEKLNEDVKSTIESLNRDRENRIKQISEELDMIARERFREAVEYAFKTFLSRVGVKI